MIRVGHSFRVRRMSFLAATIATLTITGYASDAVAAGSISGKITDSVTHDGIAAAQVQFFDLDGDGGSPVATATADNNGNYTQNLPDGSYGVLTQNTQGYINKLWDNVSCSAVCDVDSLTPVVVSGGAVSNIDFDLTPGGGRIAGTITSSATGDPIAGARVYFLDSGGNAVFSTATTDVNGHYTSDGGTVTGNIFIITANGQGFQDESYNNHKCTLETCDVADLVAVTIGATAANVNFALDPGARISGTVTDASHSPLANVEVRIYDTNDNRIDAVVTDALGNFISSGLATGTYYVATRNSVGLVDYAWNNLVCANDFCDETFGTPISVTVPVTTGGINFVLLSGQTVSGTVTAAGGGPLQDAFVGLVDAAGAFVGGANTDASGAFTTGAVPQGTYHAFANANGFVQQLFNNISCSNCPLTNGTTIAVNNSPVTNVNFALLATGTGTITGTVTDTFNGNTPTGLTVQLLTTSGGQVATANTTNGVYTFNNVAAGSYYVRTVAGASGVQPGGIPFINQLYNGVACVNCSVLSGGGTLVNVSNGGTTSGIDFNLQRGGIISGTITKASDGTPLSGIGAQVFDSAGTSVGTYNTDGAGVFFTAGLPAGNYYVRTSNTAGYINQQWQNKACPQSACLITLGTPVAVAGTATTGGIDFALALGGRISGKVTNASNAQGLATMPVAIFSSSGVNFGSVNTDSSGNYTTSGLPPGLYFLRTASTGPSFVNNQQLFFIDQLYSGKPCVPACLNPTTGTPITVTSGTTTPNINFALTTGGSIFGTVFDAATGIGLSSVGVQIYTSTGVLARAGFTNGGGGYTIGGLLPGTYYARTSMPDNVFYEDELYNGMPCSSGCLVTTGTSITVLSGITSHGIDFALSTGAGGMSGTITDKKTGLPLFGVSVQIYTAGGMFTKSANTNLAGAWATAGLAPGNYFARTFQDVPTGHSNELYNGARCLSNCVVTTGTAIVVAAGATTNAIDFSLGSFLAKSDFDADGKSDVAVWRRSTGGWLAVNSSNASVTSQLWGAGFAPYNDIPVPGDYDGDGKTDFAVWRPATGAWLVINSSTNSVTNRTWGAGNAPNNDIPVPGDYDGDGKTDFAVWRPASGTWYIVNSSDNSVTTRAWGAGYAPYNDKPVAADYDGDGKTDIAVWRPSSGSWLVINSSNNSVTVRGWGAGVAPYNDVPVPADYDGDGKADFAVWRPASGTWYVINSSNNSTTSRAWGAGYAPYNDVPVPADYDGDGKADFAVWRASSGNWLVIQSSTNSVMTRMWGAGYAPYNDVAVPSFGIR